MKIFIATHKKVDFPQNKIYIPIQVGAEYNKSIDVSLRDNENDNISNKNSSFCELTALYWIWKNCHDDIIGLVHYRRYFFKRKYTKNIKEILNEKEINKIMEKYDIILPDKKYLKNYNVYEQYEKLHNIEDLNECKNIIKNKYPDYIKSFEKVMKNQYLYPYNMFIGRKNRIDEYCEWVFSILFELEKKIDISKYDKYNARVYGFLAERLFNVWIEKNIEKDKIKEVYVNNTEGNVFKEQVKNRIIKFLVKGKEE